MHPSELKQRLRLDIAERLQRISEKDRAAESRTLCRELLKQIPEGAMVCAYMAMRTETQLDLLINTLLERGDRIFLPCFNGTLIFRQMFHREDLRKGQLGVLEPSADAPPMDASEPHIVLVPGIAFDKNGNRLGRGNGGYDKWIAWQRSANPGTQHWGIAFECQIVDAIPTESHDQRMDAIATARGLTRCA